jgi:plasmid replication initiation protein
MEQIPLFKIDSYTVKPVEHVVTKANTLIEANYRLTLTQQRIVLLMASLVQPEDEDFKWYRLTVGGFTGLLDIDRPGLYRDMVGMVDDLMRVILTIPQGGDEYLKTHWVQSAKYKVGTGYVDVSFDPKLKPFFLGLKERFTSYKLNNVIRLKSVYSIRIYELLKQYQSIGKRTITIEALREMLGIEPKEYHLYGDFKRYVLQVAHHEINEKTDILVEYREIKDVRRVAELEFTVTMKAASGQPVPPISPGDNAAVKLKKKIDRYMAKLAPDELERLTMEATDRARQQCPALYRSKKKPVPEHVVRGFMFELAMVRVKDNGKKRS